MINQALKWVCFAFFCTSLLSNSTFGLSKEEPGNKPIASSTDQVKSEDAKINLSGTNALRWVGKETRQKLFDVDDIVRFDWDKQIFELTRRAAMDLLGKQTGLYRNFTLISDMDTIYSGTLVSISSSISFQGPAIILDREDLDGIKPPLFKIDNGYPEPIAKSDPDPRFSERLKKDLQQADVLSEIDVNNPPVPIERVTHGWFGEKDGLKVLVEVFPETFRLRRQVIMHIHLTGAKNLDKNYVFDVNATLISKDGKSKFSTKKIFSSHGTGWKNIYVLEMNPWGATGDSRNKNVKPGNAKLSVEVFTRKVLNEHAKTYSDPIDHVKTDAINVTVQPGRALLPQIPSKVMVRFQKAIKDSDWEKALTYCSEKIKSKAEGYDSIETFFKYVLPIDEIAALSEFQISGRGSRNKEVISYSSEIKLKDPNYRYPLHWNLSVRREDSNWVVEFPTKPLDIWLKHAILKMKVANDHLLIEPEKGRAGFEVRLIPLTKEFTIGSPMLFRIEMKNISDETLGYIHTTSVMVNDPMSVIGPKDDNVPYFGGNSCVSAAPEFVEPGETIILADNYDARSQYHITKPGKYTFQFREAFTINPSNSVEVDIKPRQLSALESVVENLILILPAGWKLTRRAVPANQFAEEQTGEAILVSLTGKRTGKRVDIAIQMAIFLDSDHAQVKLRDHLTELEFWGQSQWGPVYVKSINAEQLWPNYKEQIIKALGIEEIKSD